VKKISSAVILAAGYSSRLGQPKALVKWNEETLIERSIRLLEEAGIKKTNDFNLLMGQLLRAQREERSQ